MMGKIEKHSELLLQGEKRTLLDEKSEVNAKIYIKAKDNIRIVYVDRGLINQEKKTKKCDFMVLGMNTNKTHMIELKGANVNAAFEQISRTIDCMFEDSELKDCVILREILDAYIVSPERQKIPNIPSFEERELVKKLARGTKNKPKNIFALLHFVKVLKNQRRVVESGRQIIISGQAPIEFD